MRWDQGILSEDWVEVLDLFERGEEREEERRVGWRGKFETFTTYCEYHPWLLVQYQR